MKLSFKILLLMLTAAVGAGSAAPVFAAASETLPLNKPALELSLGESELLEGAGNITYTSADPSVATVTESGVVKGVGVGETTVSATSSSGARATVPVYVIEKERSFDDNILISVFWPPTAEYMNGGEGDERWDEQFKLLSDAHIDYLCNVTGRDRQQNIGDHPRMENTKETNLKMALFSHKYGMRYSVADERFSDFLRMENWEIEELIGEYRNVPGVGGYYILDEPFDPMPYAPVHESIKLADESGYTHLNFQPIHAYGSTVGTLDEVARTRYRSVLSKWLAAGEECGFPQDYLMFDFYPYTDTAGGMARDIYFSNLAAVREVGLQYNVKTANYLQSVSSVLQASGALAFRSATPAEIRYEAMLSLAYGYKQLSYFTWFQPTNRNGETFSNAIISAEGVPSPVYYDAVTALNAEIHNLGRTLISLDAEEVYLNGDLWGGQESIPEGFLLQPTDRKNYTASLLRHKETGKRYLMVVNNDYAAPLETVVKLEVPFVRHIRPSDGEAEVLPLDGGTLNISLAAGDGVLYVIPEEGESPEPQTPATPSDPSAPETPADSETKGGCGSVIGLAGGGGALLILAAAVLCIRGKKS